MATSLIYTVGHSTHDIEHFVSLLQQRKITAVADVRSVPASQFTPQFNQDALKRRLTNSSIKYVFMGRELGARSTDPSHYVAGRVQYERLAASSAFRNGIDRLIEGTSTESVAVMCTEKDPLDCHRTLLVAPALVDQDVDIYHILEDGRLEGHQDAMQRLMTKFGLGEPDLLHSQAELLAEAMRRQELRIAYVDEDVRRDR